MKPLFIALSLLLMFGNVHADELLTDQMSLTSQADETTGDQSLFNDDDTYFNQIGEMFAQGTLPTAEETLGWWSGRCYKPDSPNRPFNDLLVFRTDDSQGPAFPLSYQTFGLYAPTAPAGYFDTLTEVKRIDVKKSLSRWFSPTAQKKNGSWFTRPTTEPKAYATELRKYQNYFIKRIFSSEGDKLTVIKYCYAFKKIYSY